MAGEGAAGLLFSPLVFTADLVLLLGSEVVLDVEGLANLLGRLALDHVGDGLAANVQQGFNIEVVRGLKDIISSYLFFPQPLSFNPRETYQDNLKEHLLIDLHELLIPLVDVGGLTPGVVIVTSAGRVALVVSAPFDHLAQDSLVNLLEKTSVFIFLSPEKMEAGEGGREGLLTLGMGIASSDSPKSSSMFLIRMERSATSRSKEQMKRDQLEYLRRFRGEISSV